MYTNPHEGSPKLNFYQPQQEQWLQGNNVLRETKSKTLKKGVEQFISKNKAFVQRLQNEFATGTPIFNPNGPRKKWCLAAIFLGDIYPLQGELASITYIK